MYRIIFTHHFKAQLKKLVKKDAKLKERLLESLENFEKTSSIFIGKNVYKIRLPGISRGKSGGYRAYLFILECECILTPLWIYRKNDQQNLSEKELIHHLSQAQSELQEWMQS